MAELGYVPNVAAQMLASGLTYNVGLIFPPLITPDRLNEPFFMQILSTITSEAKINDFTVSIATGMTVEELEEQVGGAILDLLDNRALGALVLLKDEKVSVYAVEDIQEAPYRSIVYSINLPVTILKKMYLLTKLMN